MTMLMPTQLKPVISKKDHNFKLGTREARTPHVSTSLFKREVFRDEMGVYFIFLILYTCFSAILEARLGQHMYE